jgi:hypothetical protein
MKMWEPQPPATSTASAACTGIDFYLYALLTGSRAALAIEAIRYRKKIWRLSLTTSVLSIASYSAEYEIQMSKAKNVRSGF